MVFYTNVITLGTRDKSQKNNNNKKLGRMGFVANYHHIVRLDNEARFSLVRRTYAADVKVRPQIYRLILIIQHTLRNDMRGGDVYDKKQKIKNNTNNVHLRVGGTAAP